MREDGLTFSKLLDSLATGSLKKENTWVDTEKFHSASRPVPMLSRKQCIRASFHD